jgi:PKD repeat protein
MRSELSLSRRSALLIAIVSPLLLGSYFKCVAVSNPSVSAAQISGIEPAAPRVGEVVQFLASGTGTPPLQFSWNFGDGTFGAGRQAAHVYEAPGDYRIGLTVRDGLGSLASDAEQVVVSARVPSPKADVLLLTDAIAGQPVVLSARARDTDGGAHTYVWMFNDGQTFAGSEVVAIFALPGVYVASVTMTDDLEPPAVEQFVFDVEAEKSKLLTQRR